MKASVISSFRMSIFSDGSVDWLCLNKLGLMRAVPGSTPLP